MPTDPRIVLVEPTTAEQILDDAIRHGTYLERFKAHEVPQLLRVLEKEVLPDLVEQITGRLAGIAARGYDTGPATTQRLQEMKDAIERVLEQHGATMQGILQGDLGKLAPHEAAWQAKIIERAVPVDLTLRLPTAAMLSQLVNTHPVQGAVLEDWFGRMNAATASRVTSELTIGISEGQTLQQMVRRLDGVLDATRAGVEATARSFVVGVSARAREEVARENSDIISGMRWVATLDDRICPICLPRDGKVYPVDEGFRPPAHPNCRCSMVPVLKPWGKGIGLPPGQRAAAGGPIADTITGEEWFDSLPKAQQDDIVGVRKAAAYRAGKITLKQMLDQTGRPFTIDELIAKDLI